MMEGYLRPGGRLVIVTVDAHEHEDLAATYHHHHPGGAGLPVDSCQVTSRERRLPRPGGVTAFAAAPAQAREGAERKRRA